MSKKITAQLVAVAALVVTVASGCGSGTSSSQNDSIKIGMTSALTGPYSEFGEGNRRAVELAVEEWNSKGGINGKRINLIVLDDQLDPNKAAVNIKQLMEQEKVVAIIGPAGSGPALASVPLAEAKNIPYINPIAQTVQVTYPNGTDKAPRKNVFTFAIQNDVEANVLANFAGQRWKRIALIGESTSYGKSGIELIKNRLRLNYGIQPVDIEEYNQKAPDVTPQLAKIQRSEAEVIVAVGLGADAATIRKGMDRLGMKIPLVGTNGLFSLPYQELAGELVVGSIGSMLKPFASKPLSPEAKTFADAYEKKWGRDRWWGTGDIPQPFMALSSSNAYDGANVLFEAIKRANSTDSNKIIEELNNIRDYKGVNATYSFTSQKHHAIEEKDLSLFQYRKVNGQIVLEELK